MNWRARAHCRDVDPEMFFDEARHAEAWEHCRRCAVQYRCFIYGRDNRELEGIFGGVWFDAEYDDIKPCGWCPNFFTPSQPHQKYCSDPCRREANKVQTRERMRELREAAA